MKKKYIFDVIIVVAFLFSLSHIDFNKEAIKALISGLIFGGYIGGKYVK